MMKDDDKQFLQRVNTRLDAELQQLDAQTLARLRASRQAAIATLDKKWRFSWTGRISLAVAASLVVAVVSFSILNTSPALLQGELDEMLLLSASDDLELYDNLEFYQWLLYEEPQG